MAAPSYRELLAQAARLDREIRAERVRRIRAAIVNTGNKTHRLQIEVMCMEEGIRQTIVDYKMFDEHLDAIEDILFE